MKSYEMLLRENCPAVFDWHAKVSEQKDQNFDPFAAFAPSNKVIVEVVDEEPKPVIKEWRTVFGKRVIDESFANQMTAGY